MKLFVVSDVHGFYTEMKKALDEAGFDPNNKDHLFISCGDLLDRGEESVKCLEYVNSLPRRVLIKGNHEDLRDTALARKECLMHDYHNGTVKTIDDLAEDYAKKNGKKISSFEDIFNFAVCNQDYQDYKNSLVDYKVISRYVFVHAWYPRGWNFDGIGNILDYHLIPEKAKAWDKARWDNPFVKAPNAPKTGYTIVHGHFCNSYGWAQIYGEHNSSYCYSNGVTYDIIEHDGLIGLDTCTVLTKRVNCLVLEV